MTPKQDHSHRWSSCLLPAIVTLLASATGVLAQQPGSSPVKIFILAGQSNMQGQGNMSPSTTPGTLEYTVANDPAGDYQFVRAGRGWKVWDDVWIHYERNATTLLTGDLTVGYGVSDTTIGPELGFGSVVGDYYDNQVLLIKAAWGGKSLAVDFRPPSSGWSVNPPAVVGDQGFYYNEILRLVQDATTKLGTYFPGYDGQGYEITGFGWHQGWNDRVNQTFNDEYEVNMANFIRDIRSDLGIPGLPVVIATTGMSGWEETHPRALSLMDAQLAVAQYREFRGNVFTVETRGFYRPVSESPANQGYHWNRNAATYLDIGLAMGEAMTKLAPTEYDRWAGNYPGADLGDPDGDFDGDRLTNNEERVWGLDPTSGSSANPYAIPLDATGAFSYTRRDPMLSGLTYTIWTSPNMQPGSWTEDTGASAGQTPGAADANNVQTVAVTLSPGLLNAPELFVRVRAAE